MNKKQNYNEFMREYMSRRYVRRKEKAIKQLGGSCVQCGSTDRLQFDHKIPRSKTRDGFVISARIAGVAESRLNEELSKCQLLCFPCHAKKTLAEMGRVSAKGTHGTMSSYAWCGPPRCSACREAMNKYKRENKRKNREKRKL